MNFSDLLAIDYDRRSNRIDRARLAEYLPNTPEVIRDVYADHGRKHDFQDQYGTLDIGSLIWRSIDIKASTVLTCSVYPAFSQWVENVARRVDNFSEDGWPCIDVRPEVVAYWTANHTWLTPPVLVEASLKSDSGVLHLMEGHTRVGVLRGLVRHQILAASSRHQIWRGTL